MPDRFCLILAVALLASALVVGNPFLGRTAKGGLVGKEDAVDKQDAVAKEDAGLGTAGGAIDVLAASKSCPDPRYRDLVVEVRSGLDGSVWLLRDGRKLQLDPRVPTGDVLIEIGASAPPSGGIVEAAFRR